MIRYYDSPSHMYRDAKDNCSGQQAWNQGNTNWGGERYSDLESLIAQGGEESDVPQALKLLDKLMLELPETGMVQYAPSVTGAFGIVPEALAGLPDCMRYRLNDFTNNAPIRIGVVTTVSASIKREAFRLKAAAMLAILMHLNNSGRAVELYGIAHLHGLANGETVLAYRIPSQPISLAEVNMALGNLAFARRIPFAIGEQYNSFNGCWPNAFDQPNGIEYTTELAKRMGFQMILPSLHEAEAKKIVSDPAKWMLDKYNAIQASLETDIAA
jgi:hypothetical protein